MSASQMMRVSSRPSVARPCVNVRRAAAPRAVRAVIPQQAAFVGRRAQPQPLALASRVVSTAAATEEVSAVTTDRVCGECTLKNLKMSVFKVRRVINQLRGRSYEECLVLLEFMPYRACEPVKRCLMSAAANAKFFGLNKSQLYVEECFADQGPYMKRFRPRAQGRANKILKPTCRVYFKVSERSAGSEIEEADA